MNNIMSKYFTVSDGTKLHYMEAGTGKPLVMIHGWGQSAESFKYNIPELAKHFRVIAVDQRGHGESEKPNHGYRLARLSKDIHDMLVGLDLNDVNILGWSMGCSVIWSYWDTFGSERLSKMILVDEPAWLLKCEENELGLWTYEELLANCKAILEDKAAYSEDLISGLLTKQVTKDEKDQLIGENMKMPAEYTVTLAFTHWLGDWRDVIPTITIPTLIIGGKKSFVNWKSQVWNHEHIPNSKLELFDERGHLLFFEEPERFNSIVKDFID